MIATRFWIKQRDIYERTNLDGLREVTYGTAEINKTITKKNTIMHRFDVPELYAEAAYTFCFKQMQNRLIIEFWIACGVAST